VKFLLQAYHAAWEGNEGWLGHFLGKPEKEVTTAPEARNEKFLKWAAR